MRVLAAASTIGNERPAVRQGWFDGQGGPVRQNNHLNLKKFHFGLKYLMNAISSK